MNNRNRELSINASYKVLVHLAKQFHRRRIFKINQIRNKNRLWRPCLLMDLNRNDQSLQRTFHICFLPSFGSFGQMVSENIFKHRPIRNTNCMWRPCLLIDRSEMCNLNRGPTIDASYQVSIHLAEGF